MVRFGSLGGFAGNLMIGYLVERATQAGASGIDKYMGTLTVLAALLAAAAALSLFFPQPKMPPPPMDAFDTELAGTAREE